MKSTLMRELRMRGLVLEILKSEPHEYIDVSDLQARLYLFGHAMLVGEIMPHLRYLEDRKYIRIEKKLAGEIVLIKITADGDSLVRGLNGITDEGVLIPRCERPHGQ